MRAPVKSVRSELTRELGLAAACALHPGASMTGAFDRCDPEGFLEAVRVHQLRPVAFDCLQRHAAPTESMQRLASALRPVAAVHGAHSTMLAAELLRCHHGLQRRNVWAIPFKGPLFCAAIGMRPALREMGDLDFLIARDRLGEAVHVLAELGFQSPLSRRALASRWLAKANDELLLVRPDDGCAIELHWRLGQAWFPTLVKFDEVVRHSGRMAFFSEDLPVPCPEHLFLLHAADGLKAGGAALRWAIDLILIVARHGASMDWDRVLVLAGRNGAGLAAQAALELARRVALTAGQVAAATPAASFPPSAARGRVRALADTMLHRMNASAQMGGALPNFWWALRISDRRLQTAAEFACHLTRPALADLADYPTDAKTDFALRLKAFRRRVRAVAAGG